LVLKACAITSGKIHPSVKNSTTPPLLKKPSLDNAEQSNYRPISNWSFYLKTTERAVKACLTDDLSRNNLLNANQSACCKKQRMGCEAQLA